MLKFRRYRKLLFYFFLTLSLVVLASGAYIYYQFSQAATQTNQTNYKIYQQAPFNQPSYYPLNKSVSAQYQPIATWMGRLILPSPAERKTVKGVLFEVAHADKQHQNLVGKIVNLRWSNAPDVQAYRQIVSKDLHFTEQTKTSEKQGNLHPDRLDNWQKVDPLESLAGARPDDNVVVMLNKPIVVESAGSRPSLLINKEPIQITGRYYGLVTIDQPVTKGSANDRFSVHHYNRTSTRFDGQPEIIRIPQVPAARNRIFRSKSQGIEKSPLNATGWYIYGAKNAEDIFVVQAIAPRAIFQLQPNQVVLKKAAINYINNQYWKNTQAQKGKAATLLLDPGASQNKQAIAKWQEGDKAILLHTFGGIGGKKAEAAPLGVVTGHFVYGLAQVVREPLTQELRFEINYRQVYAHNPDGIVAGTIAWAAYMGDLQRGWLGNRPVSDLLVKFEAVTEDYDFDGFKVSPLTEFTQQMEVMMARYRIGDGTGAAVVKPATSCVQDANQALYVTIKRIEAAITSNPQIQDWLKRHPHEPQTQRFEQLVQLGRSLEHQLLPLGIVRSDWQKNAQTLAGTQLEEGSFRNFMAALTTWRTLLPRRAHDEIATIFLKNKASIWSIRTYQVGGLDPNIEPLAPTALLSHRSH